MDGCIRSSFCFVTVSSWGEWAGEVKLRVETRQHELVLDVQKMVNINTRLNEVDQCCFYKNFLEKVWESVWKDLCEHN